MIQTQIIVHDDRDADAGLHHGPCSCPSQLVEAEWPVCDAFSAPNRMSNEQLYVETPPIKTPDINIYFKILK